MEDQLFFVGIKDHLDIRRELLTSSKGLIDAMKRYEKYKMMKEEKLLYILELKRVFDELLLLNKKLRGKLPKVPIKIPNVPMQTADEDVRVEKQKLEKPLARERSKLDVLEEELAKVEQRLSSLD